MKIVDLSIPLENDIPADPPQQKVSINYFTHESTVEQIASYFPGLRREDLPDGLGWAVEHVNISTHNGTHVDAPWHYHPTMDGGVRATTIDEAPLDLFYRPGVKLDFRHFDDGYLVTPKDINDELDRIGHTLKPLDIILVNTKAGERYGKKNYIDSGCGFGRDATLYLIKQGIKVVGTDAWSWDAPFSHTARRFSETKDASLIWEGHKAGREKGYYQIEKLHNLDLLPDNGFLVSCFPVKVKNGSAGWTRAVAILGGYKS